MTERDLKEMLDREAARINNIDFIDRDPVQFPRSFEKLQDIEIVALLSATIAWGNRKMICNSCEKMLSLMDHDPYNYVMDKGYEDLPDMNIHRTFFAKDFRHFLRGLNTIYSRHASLADFAKTEDITVAELPSWTLVERMNREFAAANGGVTDSRCLPGNLTTTALKRVNMALRWLVRDDGIVDMGVWDFMSPSRLFIPLDVHVGNTARQLGLLERNANDKKSVIMLTERLRAMRPDDPVWYDYALFGLGVDRELKIED